ncbi:hypothetical protein BGZ63DRAFT_402095 [Mariannaea sp. PMI_226]|nr:hypothetical protein BGZ63DRAFT_402095 [Mariannaea sp. PMI_226]
MATFVRSCSHPGEIPLSTGFDTTTSMLSYGCLTTPPPHGTSIDSPKFQTKTILGCGMNQSPMLSFSGEVISTSSITTQMGYPFSPYSTRTTTILKFPKVSQPPEASLPTHYNQHNEPYQLQTFVYPSVVLPKSEHDTAKASKDVPNGRIRGRTQGKKRGGEQKGANKRMKRDDTSTKVRTRDSRRQLILERNKLAAIKCRKRKQDEESALATCEQEMEQCNGELKKEFDELTVEIYFLKTQLLRHTDCSCTLIHKYMAHEARKSVVTLPPPPTLFQPETMLTVEHQSGSNGSTASDSSLIGVTNSYGLRTPELEIVPPIWPDMSQLDTSPSTEMFDTTMDVTQNGYIPASSKLMHWIPSMDGLSYPARELDIDHAGNSEPVVLPSLPPPPSVDSMLTISSPEELKGELKRMISSLGEHLQFTANTLENFPKHRVEHDVTGKTHLELSTGYGD